MERLNKRLEGVYIIEEKKITEDGMFEGHLDHDNINKDTIVIYTEPGFKGNNILWINTNL